MKTRVNEKISTGLLVLLITGAIDSIRNLPATAMFGSSLIFFFVLSALIFLIPVALVSAELSSTWSHDEGGIYSWVRHAFGDRVAFFAIWLQWINTMVWYPTILSFIAGTLAYVIDPALAQNKLYLIGVILTVFWSQTLIGLAGIHASALFASICAIIGMIIPMALIIILALIWLFSGNPIQVSLAPGDLIPNLSHSQSWVSLIAIITSFLGMELACVHVKNVNNPQKNFPKAIFFSVLLILTTMILGSLAIAFVLPQNQIGLIDGVMQAFSRFFAVYHLSKILPLITIMLLIGSVGGMINWIISPAKGLLMAADHGMLPTILNKRNHHGVASRILILQAILVTLLCSAFYLIPSVNGFYWLFTDLSTELYVMMYVLMFFAAIKLKTKYANMQRPFAVPGKKIGYYTACILGLIGCFITLVVGFITPGDGIDTGNFSYPILFGIGVIILLFPAILIIIYRSYPNRIKHGG